MKFSSFIVYHLKSVIAKPGVDASPQHFHQVGAIMLLSPNFYKTQNQSSIINSVMLSTT